MTIFVMDNLQSDSERWNAVNWARAEAIVWWIQTRIVKAVKAGDKRRVRSLQRLLTRSRSAKLLAVKPVTSNQGKNTAGIDGTIWKTPSQKWQAALKLNRKDYKPLPLRRKFIPKKNGKKRPLGILTMQDRAEIRQIGIGFNGAWSCCRMYGWRTIQRIPQETVNTWCNSRMI